MCVYVCRCTYVCVSVCICVCVRAFSAVEYYKVSGCTQCTPYIVRRILYCVYCTGVYCTAYIVRRVLYGVYCTPYAHIMPSSTVHFTMDVRSCRFKSL